MYDDGSWQKVTEPLGHERKHPYSLTALGEEMWDGCRVILSG